MKHIFRFELEGIKFIMLTYEAYMRIRSRIHEVDIIAYLVGQPHASSIVHRSDFKETHNGRIVFIISTRECFGLVPHNLREDDELVSDIENTHDCDRDTNECFISFDKVKEAKEFSNYKLRNL